MRVFLIMIVLVLLTGRAYFAAAQAQPASLQVGASNSHVDIAPMYTFVRANTVDGTVFTLQGGSLQIHARIWKRLGAVAEFSRAEGDAVNRHYDVIFVGGGPRLSTSSRRVDVFLQGMVGEALGVQGDFASASSNPERDHALAFDAGGGIDVNLARRFSIRLAQVSWFRSQLGNGTNDVQNSLLLRTGCVFHF